MSSETEKVQPDSWQSLMRGGEFEAAWQLSDADLRARAGKPCWHLPRHFQGIWDGSPLLDKRVLVRCYHGLGDTIQFVRYIPLVKQIARETIVWAQPELIPLLETAAGIDRILPLDDGAPAIEFDVDVEIMELPHVFRTILQTIPSQVPYLRVAPATLEKSENRIFVGLVWQGGDWDARRSIDFSLFAPLSEILNVEFYILQANAKRAGWTGDFGINLGDFNLFDFARAVRAMDLLISVDSMPAHLAGALAVPVWTLLHREADWRWMQNRDDSPWYPTMRLFRQTRAGDWQTVIERVAAELEKLTRIRLA